MSIPTSVFLRERNQTGVDMAKRVTSEEIVEMNRLYQQIGNYADVAKIVGRSASTVARYVKLSRTPQIVREVFKESI